MKHKRSYLKFGNKKGFILTLDLVLGLIILFTIFSITLFFMSRGSESSFGEHQLHRVGSDVVMLIDKQQNLDNLNFDTIETELEELLPGNVDALLRIEGNFSQGNGTIEIGGSIPNEKLVVSGRRAALTQNQTYLLITYFIWARQQ